MSLYIPQMSDTPGVTIPGLASNFNALANSRIVEQGSNANGEYIRWENGLQVCWHILEGTNTDPTNTSWHVEEGFVEWNIPASFVGRFLVLAFVSTSGWHTGVRGDVLDTDTTTIRLGPAQPRRIIPYRVLVYTDGGIYVSAFAIGRWK